MRSMVSHRKGTCVRPTSQGKYRLVPTCTRRSGAALVHKLEFVSRESQKYSPNSKDKIPDPNSLVLSFNHSLNRSNYTKWPPSPSHVPYERRLSRRSVSLLSRSALLSPCELFDQPSQSKLVLRPFRCSRHEVSRLSTLLAQRSRSSVRVLLSVKELR